MEVGSELFPKKKKKYLFKDGSEADGLRGRRTERETWSKKETENK